MSAATTAAAPRYLAAATTSEPIGPAPLTSDVAAAHVAGPVHGVQRDGQRLGQRAVLGARRRRAAAGAGRRGPPAAR